MSVPQVVDGVIRYVSEAVARIFGLNDDSYPNTGVQPFEGDPYNKTNSQDW